MTYEVVVDGPAAAFGGGRKTALRRKFECAAALVRLTALAGLLGRRLKPIALLEPMDPRIREDDGPQL
jgi:hypothetical protein